MRTMQATRAEQVKLQLKSSMSSGGIITINKVQTLLYSICRLNSWRALHPLEPRAPFSLGGSKIISSKAAAIISEDHAKTGEILSNPVLRRDREGIKEKNFDR